MTTSLDAAVVLFEVTGLEAGAVDNRLPDDRLANAVALAVADGVADVKVATELGGLSVVAGLSIDVTDSEYAASLLALPAAVDAVPPVACAVVLAFEIVLMLTVVPEAGQTGKSKLSQMAPQIPSASRPASLKVGSSGLGHPASAVRRQERLARICAASNPPSVTTRSLAAWLTSGNIWKPAADSQLMNRSQYMMSSLLRKKVGVEGLYIKV